MDKNKAVDWKIVEQWAKKKKLTLTEVKRKSAPDHDGSPELKSYVLSKGWGKGKREFEIDTRPDFKQKEGDFPEVSGDRYTVWRKDVARAAAELTADPRDVLGTSWQDEPELKTIAERFRVAERNEQRDDPLMRERGGSISDKPVSRPTQDPRKPNKEKGGASMVGVVEWTDVRNWAKAHKLNYTEKKRKSSPDHDGSPELKEYILSKGRGKSKREFVIDAKPNFEQKKGEFPKVLGTHYYVSRVAVARAAATFAADPRELLGPGWSDEKGLEKIAEDFRAAERAERREEREERRTEERRHSISGLPGGSFEHDKKEDEGRR